MRGGLGEGNEGVNPSGTALRIEHPVAKHPVAATSSNLLAGLGSCVTRRVRATDPPTDAMTAGAMSSPRRESHGSASNQGYGVFQKPRRSISTDSFLREATPLNLPSKYYTRRNRTPLNLAICVAGVLASLCIYGVLQERLMTIPYGGTTSEPEKAEMFTSSVFLVLMNRIVTVCVSAVGIYLTGDSFRTSTPLNLYASIAFSNLVTTVCQYEVLKYLSFAASTLAKCAKIIPVMIWGWLILHKRYKWIDYAMAFTVTAGCFLFVLDRGVIQDRQLRHQHYDDRSPPSRYAYRVDDAADGTYGPFDETTYHSPSTRNVTRRRGGGGEGGDDEYEEYEDASGAEVLREIVSGGGGKLIDSVMEKGVMHMYVLGTVIMVVYLMFDGFTSTFQQKLYRHYTCSILNQIFFTTCFSSVFSLAWLLSTSQMGQVWEFMGRHPGAIQDVFVLSVSAAVSQFAISYTIFCFGAVTLASVMTSRQFLSVVISSFIFGNPLSGLQWLGGLMVLVPVFERVYTEVRKPTLFGSSQGGDQNSADGNSDADVEESPRAGLGYGPPGQIPDNYFSARGTGYTPRSSANYAGGFTSPRSSEGGFSPRSSISDGAVRSNMSDVEKPANTNERSKLLKR